MGNAEQKGAGSQRVEGGTDRRKADVLPVKDEQLVLTFRQHASSDSRQNKVLLESDFTDKMFRDVPLLGRMLYRIIRLLPGGSDTRGGSTVEEGGAEGVDLEGFVRGVEHMRALMTGEEKLEFYFRTFCESSDGSMTSQEALLLLQTCMRVHALVTLGLDSGHPVGSDPILNAAVKSLVGSDSDAVTQSAFCGWCHRLCPRLVTDLHVYVTIQLHGAANQQVHSASALASRCTGGAVSAFALWLCATVLPPVYFPDDAPSDPTTLPAAGADADLVVYDRWHLLYDSGSHGLSVNRFQYHVLDYAGPTLMFISFERLLYALAVDQPWKESRQRWGGSDCKLIQLLPDYRLCQSGEGLVHYSLQDRTVPRGIQFGKDLRTTFLKLDAELDRVNHYGVDHKISAIEVWGCGGRGRLETQHKHRQWERREVDRQQNRKLVPEDWKDSVDRQLLQLGGVQTEHAQRGDL